QLHHPSKHSMLSFAGVLDASSQQFKKKILRQLAMFEVSNGYGLTPKAAMHFSRTNLARFKRRDPNNRISIIIGGFDPTSGGPELHCIDNNGMAASVPYVVRGSHPEFCDDLLHVHYKPNLHQEAAYFALKKCVDQIQQKFVGPFDFNVFAIKKGGIERISDGVSLKRTSSGRIK
ncbi:hypothetical protein KR054_009576, partial [Drosophila jambulina]